MGEVRNIKGRRIVEIPDGITMEYDLARVAYANVPVTAYPIVYGNKFATVDARGKGLNNTKASTFINKSSLILVLNMSINSGPPNMIEGISMGEYMYGGAKPHYEDSHSYPGSRIYSGSGELEKKISFKETGLPQIIDAPADNANTRSIDVLNFIRHYNRSKRYQNLVILQYQIS